MLFLILHPHGVQESISVLMAICAILFSHDGQWSCGRAGWKKLRVFASEELPSTEYIFSPNLYDIHSPLIPLIFYLVPVCLCLFQCCHFGLCWDI